MKNRRGLLFLGLAVVMGLIAAWITSEFAPSSAEAELTATQTTPVVVVRSDVPVASSLTHAQLKLIDWPAQHVPTGAILSIAFDRSVPVVDGNVLRVLSRWFLLDGDPRRSAFRETLWSLAAVLVP